MIPIEYFPEIYRDGRAVLFRINGGFLEPFRCKNLLIWESCLGKESLAFEEFTHFSDIAAGVNIPMMKCIKARPKKEDA
jgi:hypothetical protein